MEQFNNLPVIRLWQPMNLVETLGALGRGTVNNPTNGRSVTSCRWGWISAWTLTPCWETVKINDWLTSNRTLMIASNEAVRTARDKDARDQASRWFSTDGILKKWEIKHERVKRVVLRACVVGGGPARRRTRARSRQSGRAAAAASRASVRAAAGGTRDKRKHNERRKRSGRSGLEDTGRRHRQHAKRANEHMRAGSCRPWLPWRSDCFSCHPSFWQRRSWDVPFVPCAFFVGSARSRKQARNTR